MLTNPRVSWASPISHGASVLYGTTSGHYPHRVYAETYTYTADDMCGGDAASFGWRDPGFLHTATLTVVDHATKYFYIYGSEASGYSPVIFSENSQKYFIFS